MQFHAKAQRRSYLAALRLCVKFLQPVYGAATVVGAADAALVVGVKR
jgi:hypothetical protein